MRGSERRLPPLIARPVGGVGWGAGEAGTGVGEGTVVGFASVSASLACETVASGA
jgi:hypothetical protein